MGLVEALEPIYSVIPSIKPPEVEPPLKRKLMWSGIALLMFFVLGRISLIGLPATGAQETPLAAFQEILASQAGTLLTAGIGPIVFASIILQLLVGGKIINIDLTDPAGKAKFQSLQKLFAIIMCFFQGIIYPLSGMIPTDPSAGLYGILFLGVQIAIGSILLLYLDEVVSKYGIGSGIGLFIAGGVSSRFFWQLFRPAGIGAEQGGRLFVFLSSWTTGIPNYILLLPVIIAILIYLLVIYANAIHVNIPITMGRKGFGGRYPVNLLYVSVIPVILAVALFANVRMWGAMTSGVPVLGDVMRGLTWATGNPVKEWGGAFDNSIYNLFNRLLEQVGASGLGVFARADIQIQLLQGLIYLILLCAGCVIFGKFWVKMGGQSPEDVANQLESSGMYVPGFRRDKRIIKKILNRYIPPIVVIGSIFVGVLAGIGNMALSTLGSGTGILLTVSIVYRLYQQLAKEQIKESHTLLKKLIG